MNTKQEVKLLYATPLWLISNGIRYSEANWKPIEDFNDEDLNLIRMDGFKTSYESVLEHSLITYHLKLSQKALLDIACHRIGVSWTATDSKCALEIGKIEMELTEDDDVNEFIFSITEKIKEFLDKGKSLDVVSKLLPQAFLYTVQVTFNLRSLIHFLRSGLSRSAHRDIKIIAYKMLDKLPLLYKEMILNSGDNIKDDYEWLKVEWHDSLIE